MKQPKTEVKKTKGKLEPPWKRVMPDKLIIQGASKRCLQMADSTVTFDDMERDAKAIYFWMRSTVPKGTYDRLKQILSEEECKI